jgi:hypothetical protein
MSRPRYTKHHYIATAKAIYQSGARGKVRNAVVLSFVALYSADNPQFRGDTFRVACELNLIRAHRGARLSPMLLTLPLSRKAIATMTEDEERMRDRRLMRRRIAARAAKMHAKAAMARIEYTSEGI